MTQRVLYGAAAIAAILVAAFGDIGVARWARDRDGPLADLFARGSVLPLVCLALSVVSAVEFTRLLRAAGSKPNAIFAITMVAALIVSPWASAAGWLRFLQTAAGPIDAQIILLGTTFVGSGLCLVARRDLSGSLRDAGATMLTIMYIGFLGSFAVRIRCGDYADAQRGAYLLLISILVVKASDIGAFFAGSALGTNRLAPRISPGKTWEGALGGLAAGILAAIIFTHLGPIGAAVGITPEPGVLPDGIARVVPASDNNGPAWQLGWAVLFGALLSAFGQLGDLVESCFKRDAGMKDSGRLIPRFGGILDLIDSPLLALPVAWLLLAVR